MSEYTPTTAEVRDGYGDSNLGDGSHADPRIVREQNLAEFDRWLTTIKAEAWDEAINAIQWTTPEPPDNPHRPTAAAKQD